MAPKAALKRPAASQAGPAKKRASQPRDGTPAKCKEVEAALKEATGLPTSLRGMLCATVGPALSQHKDFRHEYQQRAVMWIDEALSGVQTSLEQAATEFHTKVDGLNAEKETCEAAVTSAEANLATLKEAAAEAQVKKSDSSAAVETADAALKAALDAEASLEGEVVAAASKKEELQGLIAEEGQYAKMKAEVPKKKDADAFIRVLKKHKFEQGLLQSIQPVLMKTADDRTDFDKAVLASFEEAVAAKIVEQAKLVEDAAPTKEQRAAAKAEAQTALDAAKAAAEAAAAAAQAAEASAKDGDKTLKDAKKALKEHGPAVKEATAAAKAADAALEAFKSGPSATFAELRDRETPKEEPPAAEAAEEADEAAAQESAEPAAEGGEGATA